MAQRRHRHNCAEALPRWSPDLQSPVGRWPLVVARRTPSAGRRGREALAPQTEVVAGPSAIGVLSSGSETRLGEFGQELSTVRPEGTRRSQPFFGRIRLGLDRGRPRGPDFTRDDARITRELCSICTRALLNLHASLAQFGESFAQSLPDSRIGVPTTGGPHLSACSWWIA